MGLAMPARQFRYVATSLLVSVGGVNERTFWSLLGTDQVLDCPDARTRG